SGLRRGWTALPGTAAEAEGVEKAFAALRGKATRLSKGEATAGAIRAALPRARHAHLATHAWYDLEKGKHAATGWHPLLLCGLAFAGANREPGEGEDDGLLTALEVSELDLSGLELAVLSACETGLGVIANGDGVMGMRRAFAAAGARSVVSSLWKVDDEATRVLMERFYANLWGRKMGRLEALAESQRWMLREGKADPGVARGMRRKDAPQPAEDGRMPPYYWAAFVLSGDWRRAP
ncbi:MAG: CHAT domain-containing protein, partial [Gemmataceae bacterium]|nr:CHAT domain-containing protein [Gemmataceae bacterium]